MKLTKIYNLRSAFFIAINKYLILKQREMIFLSNSPAGSKKILILNNFQMFTYFLLKYLI